MRISRGFSETSSRPTSIRGDRTRWRHASRDLCRCPRLLQSSHGLPSRQPHPGLRGSSWRRTRRSTRRESSACSPPRRCDCRSTPSTLTRCGETPRVPSSKPPSRPRIAACPCGSSSTGAGLRSKPTRVRTTTSSNASTVARRMSISLSRSDCSSLAARSNGSTARARWWTAARCSSRA